MDDCYYDDYFVSERNENLIYGVGNVQTYPVVMT